MNMEKKVVLIAGILIVLYFVFKLLQKKFKGKLIQSLTKEGLEWVDTGLSALFFAFLIMYFIVQAFKIPSGSMMNTLLIKDHLFVNKFIYGFRLPVVKIKNEIKEEDKGVKFKINKNHFVQIYMKRFLALKNPKRGNVIIFVFPYDPSKDFIKRCIGLPGDKIEIRNKNLYVNDIPQNESYVIHNDPNIYSDDVFVPSTYRIRDNFGPIIVPEGHYFVMGDNRDSSYDSRFWGPLPSDYIKGKALFIYWPPKRIKLIK